MPLDRAMRTVDELVVHAPMEKIFQLAAAVEKWPEHLPHYRYVKFNGDVVSMSANRPFTTFIGSFNWPTWWRSEMYVDELKPSIRFYHVGGITAGMDVEWEFHNDGVAGARGANTLVRIVHIWDGPWWLGRTFGRLAAKRLIGPVFVHGIASRTLAGLAKAAESL